MGGASANQVDANELRRLFDAHGAALSLYARQWCREPDDAVQEALIELMRQTPSPQQPVAWLFMTVRRRAMNLARAEQRRSDHHRRAVEQRELWFQNDQEGPFEPRELETMLSGLPPLEREIVILRIWGELSFEQIATLVGSSSSAAHRRYARALSLLGRAINGKLNESR